MLVSHSEKKKKEAKKILEDYVIYTGGLGFIPIPVVDTLAIAGVQLAMLRELAQLYEIDFAPQLTKSIIGVWLSSVGTTLSGFKFFPGLGMAVGMIKTSAIGAAYTFALGKVFIQHFDQGGTMLDFDPIASRKYFQQEIEKGKQFVLKKKKYRNALRKHSLQQLLKDAQEQQDSLVKMQEDLLQIANSKKQKAKSKKQNN